MAASRQHTPRAFTCGAGPTPLYSGSHDTRWRHHPGRMEPAGIGLELMTALRPPTRAVRDEATGNRASGHNPGSLGTEPMDPAPPEATPEHPVVVNSGWSGGFLGEEAYQWVRSVDSLSDEECMLPFAVGLDLNTAFLAAAARPVVGLSAPDHFHAPTFPPKIPGSWLADAGRPLPHRAGPPPALNVHRGRQPSDGPGLVPDTHPRRPRCHPGPGRRGVPRRNGAAQAERPGPGHRPLRDQGDGQGRPRQAPRAPAGQVLQGGRAMAGPHAAHVERQHRRAAAASGERNPTPREDQDRASRRWPFAAHQVLLRARRRRPGGGPDRQTG